MIYFLTPLLFKVYSFLLLIGSGVCKVLKLRTFCCASFFRCRRLPHLSIYISINIIFFLSGIARQEVFCLFLTFNECLYLVCTVFLPFPFICIIFAVVRLLSSICKYNVNSQKHI